MSPNYSNMRKKEYNQIREQIERIWKRAPKAIRCKHQVCKIGGKKYSKQELWQIADRVRQKYAISRFQNNNH